MGSTSSDLYLSGAHLQMLRDRFLSLLERHVSRLTVRGTRATGCAPCHEDRTPSLSADLERGVWFCHACGIGGGVRDFAELVGEAWTNTRSETRSAKARRARFQAEQQARAVLQRRAEDRDKALCAAHRETRAEALAAADLLALFHRRPNLAEEFQDLAARTENEYSNILFKASILEARLDGEVTA